MPRRLAEQTNTVRTQITINEVAICFASYRFALIIFKSLCLLPSKVHERFHLIFIVPPVKALVEGQVHYLNGLGPRGLSAFNFRSLCERCCEAVKLKLVVYCSHSFKSLFLHVCSVAIS